MKTSNSTNLLISLFLLILFSSCSVQKKEKELKVLSWNVWHAGHSKEFPERGCKSTIDILKKSEADVILMIETYGAAPMIADSLGYHYKLLSDNLCIFSRYPISKVYTYPDRIATFNFGGVEINVEGSPVRLFDTWLHYLPDARLVPTTASESEILAWDDAGSRDDEIRTILSVLQPILQEADSIPVIMGGDFNSHSHLDWTPATKNEYNHGGAVVGWTVSKEMERNGFRDSFRQANPDPVKNLGVTWLTDADEQATPNRSDRIDFIYYQGKNLIVSQSETYNCKLGEQLSFKNEQFLYASDHGFVLTTFKISNSK